VEIKCKISEISGTEKVWNSVVTEWQVHKLEAATSDILGQGLMTLETYGYIGYLCTTNLLVIILMGMRNLLVLQDSPYFRPANFFIKFYRVADKSLDRPTSRCILYDGENISFYASLVIYI
jgi:hypothetical protein